MALAGRHSWTQEGVREARHTDRACYACGLIRRTRHEGGRHWIEFWSKGERVPGKRTPPCPGSPSQQSITFGSSNSNGAFDVEANH